MSEHTDVRKTMSRNVREEEKRAARRVKAFSRAAAVDLGRLEEKDQARSEAAAKHRRS